MCSMSLIPSAVLTDNSGRDQRSRLQVIPEHSGPNYLLLACSFCSVPAASVDRVGGGSTTLICHAVFRTDLVATLWRYADVISLESFAPHITLYAGVGTVSAGGPALSRPAVLLLDQSARFRSHANVIGRSRLSPDVARRAHVSVARGLRH
jgi:hypothetical protein